MKLASIVLVVALASVAADDEGPSVDFGAPIKAIFGSEPEVKDPNAPATRLTFGPDVDGSVPSPAPVHKAAPKPAPAPKAKPAPKQAKKATNDCADAEGITESGQKFVKAGFLGMVIPAAYFASVTFSVPDGKRFYYIVTTMVCSFASLAYLAMATGHGVYIRPFDCREFFYARYIDWAFTTPLQLTDLCGIAGASGDTTNLLIGVDVLMIASGLIGAFFEGDEKWYFWGFGCLMFLPIVMELNNFKNNAAVTSSAKKSDLYPKIANLTIITWICYPIVWYMAEGKNTLAADNEAIAYTVLDVLSKSVFGWFIISARVHESEDASVPVQPTADGGSML